MGAAEVISCEEVRARKRGSPLRQQLHEPRFKGLWPCTGIFAQAVCKPIPSG